MFKLLLLLLLLMRRGVVGGGGWSSQLESLTNCAFPVLVAARAEEELWAGTVRESS